MKGSYSIQCWDANKKIAWNNTKIIWLRCIASTMCMCVHDQYSNVTTIVKMIALACNICTRMLKQLRFTVPVRWVHHRRLLLCIAWCTLQLQSSQRRIRHCNDKKYLMGIPLNSKVLSPLCSCVIACYAPYDNTLVFRIYHHISVHVVC